MVPTKRAKWKMNGVTICKIITESILTSCGARRAGTLTKCLLASSQSFKLTIYCSEVQPDTIRCISPPFTFESYNFDVFVDFDDLRLTLHNSLSYIANPEVLYIF